MSLCDLCRATSGICNLEESFKLKSFQIIIENGRAINEDSRLIPEIEDQKVKNQITALQKDLKLTAADRGCGMF